MNAFAERSIIGFGFVSVDKTREESDNRQPDNDHNEYASRGIHHVLFDEGKLCLNARLALYYNAIFSPLGDGGDLG